MIEAIDLKDTHHNSLKTQVYLYRDKEFKRVMRYSFHKTEHPFVKISETSNGYWLSPLSTHPPEIWESAGGYEPLKTIYLPDTVNVRRTYRPLHLYFYINKDNLDAFYSQNSVYFRSWDPAPNCKIECGAKPPKRDPPKGLLEL